MVELARIAPKGGHDEVIALGTMQRTLNEIAAWGWPQGAGRLERADGSQASLFPGMTGKGAYDHD